MTETSKSARRHAGKRRLDFSLLVPGHLPGGGTPALYHLPHCGTPPADQPQAANHAGWLKGLNRYSPLAIKLATFRLRLTRQGQHPLAKAAVGFNEQISGVNEQIPGRGQSY
jgi:hypothetical protein